MVREITSKGNERIAQSFLERLWGQFPITEKTQTVQLRKASDFANELHIHVNHLNRALKSYLNKTTTQAINEHFIQESKRLLKKTDWPIQKIAMVLGFQEANHFSAFFRNHVALSPSAFRTDKKAK